MRRLVVRASREPTAGPACHAWAALAVAHRTATRDAGAGGSGRGYGAWRLGLRSGNDFAWSQIMRVDLDRPTSLLSLSECARVCSSVSQEEDPQGAICIACMHFPCTPPEFCLVTLSIREHDHGA